MPSTQLSSQTAVVKKPNAKEKFPKPETNQTYHIPQSKPTASSTIDSTQSVNMKSNMITGKYLHM
jgi:hypothetical protein